MEAKTVRPQAKSIQGRFFLAKKKFISYRKT